MRHALLWLPGVMIGSLLLYALWQNIAAMQPNPSIPLARYTLPESTEPPRTRAGAINLNTATLEELMSLPGIGEKTAAAILALRAEIGHFRYPEDLLLVRGIGSAKLSALYPLVYVEPINEGESQWN